MKTETRESQSFTDSVVAALAGEASGASTANPSGLTALEVAAGL
ncbi:MAG: hypothetical protein OXD34_08920 [bacterium]|nr:hypothetical protein [bacterium]